jgi:hypothetical protein
MKYIIKWMLISLAVGWGLNRLCDYYQSDFLEKYLDENLILLLVALLAINTATLGIILLRLGELSFEYKAKFPKIISSMKQSIWEQLVLIAIGTLSLIFHSSKVVQKEWPQAIFPIETIIVAVAVYAIVVVYDTAQAAFTLNAEADKLIKK